MKKPSETAKRIVRGPDFRERVSFKTTGPTRTQQSHFDQTDVNAIVERFKRTGYLPPASRQPQYGDVTLLQEDLTNALAKAQANIEIAQQYAETWQPPEPTPEPPPPGEKVETQAP